MTVCQQASGGHIVAVALPFWGHTKPLCALLAKVTRLRRVYVTLFTDVRNREMVLDEISRQFASSGEEDIRSLIRVVALPTPPNHFQCDVYKSAFLEAYTELHSQRPIPVTPHSSDMYEPVPAPQLVLVDFFCYEILKGVRSVSRSSVPVYAWQSAAITALIFLFGPERLGGNGDLAGKIGRITDQDPTVRDREIEKVYRRINEDLVQLPGLPPMYDYEHVPQIVAIPVNQAEVARFASYAYRFFEECDGIVHCAHKAFEGEALKAWQEWYGSKPVLAVGPLSPPASAEDIKKEINKSPVVKEAESFLNEALNKCGPNSVIYISFGTVWWSSEPEKIWTFVDVLIEQGIPFFLSHASPVAVIPEEFSARIRSSGLGYVSTWLPQQMILRHKACGWFVTHGGHNSVMESLTAGVPLICWPYDADQPTNAANVAFTHGTGYELFEVRNGHGLRPVHRLGNKSPSGTLEAVRQEAIEVLTKARGEDGEGKRAKAQWFSEQFAKTWEEGGEGWDEIKKLLQILE